MKLRFRNFQRPKAPSRHRLTIILGTAGGAGEQLYRVDIPVEVQDNPDGHPAGQLLAIPMTSEVNFLDEEIEIDCVEVRMRSLPNPANEW